MIIRYCRPRTSLRQAQCRHVLRRKRGAARHKIGKKEEGTPPQKNTEYIDIEECAAKKKTSTCNQMKINEEERGVKTKLNLNNVVITILFLRKRTIVLYSKVREYIIANSEG